MPRSSENAVAVAPSGTSRQTLIVIVALLCGALTTIGFKAAPVYVRVPALLWQRNTSVQSTAGVYKSSAGKTGALLVAANLRARSHNLNMTARASKCVRTNNVLPRYGMNMDFEKQRPWSITTASFPLGTLTSPECTTLRELLNAVENGRRSWLTGPPDETKRSVFVAKGCAVRHWTGAQARDLLKRFPFVGIVGDSLTRHMTQGLMMILSGNYETGGIIPDAQGTWRECTCDGMFSESLSCRMLSPQQYENPCFGPCKVNLPVCPGWAREHVCTAESETPSLYMDRAHKGIPKLTSKMITDRCDNDGRRMAFFLQGGAHFMSDWKRALKLFFRPAIGMIRNASVVCRGKHGSPQPIILVSGLNAQSRLLDGAHPIQTREKAIVFNQAVRKALAHEPGLVFIDFFNVTLNAQTSDGYHFLSDVNVAKADVFLSALELFDTT